MLMFVYIYLETTIITIQTTCTNIACYLLVLLFVSDQNTAAYNCSRCGKTYKRKDALLEHCRSLCTSILKSCSKCGKFYQHKNSLLRHIQFECGKEAGFSCPVAKCQYKAKQACSVKRHFRVIHSNALQQ